MKDMTTKISAIAFGALLAAMLVPAAVAHADDRDSEFMNFVESHGIHLGNQSQTINMAHVMCQDLESGYSQKDEVDQLMGAGQLTQQQAEMFIGAATADYCPGKHSGKKPGS
jgi:Protein of unknown function (DUF732)